MPTDLTDLVDNLRLGGERDWIEFKENYWEPERIGNSLSGLANSACYHNERHGYFIWGIRDSDSAIVGTSINPNREKVGAEGFLPWLEKGLSNHVKVDVMMGEAAGRRVAILRVTEARATPVTFKGRSFIRVGTETHDLRNHPERERAIWTKTAQDGFERLFARENVAGNEVGTLLDMSPIGRPKGITDLDSLLREASKLDLVVPVGGGDYSITNTGALLLGRDLNHLGLEGKRIRLVLYDGPTRMDGKREDAPSQGYAHRFDPVVDTIMERMPSREEMRGATRVVHPMIPRVAVREAIANALAHQDLSSTGSPPMVEVFSDRLEVTNLGVPLIPTDRLLDYPPRSRNEILSSRLHDLGICENRGSGIDKIVWECEKHVLPAPTIVLKGQHTVVTLFGREHFPRLTTDDLVWAAYLHSCLQHVYNKSMTNATLRERLGIDDASRVSRILGEATERGFVRRTGSGVRNYKYPPHWAIG